MTKENKGMCLGLLGVIGFGLTLPATKYALPYMNPFFIGFGRSVFAAIVAVLLLVFLRQKIPSRSQLKQIIIVSLGVVIGFPFFTSWAMQHVSATHGGVVVGVLPLFTAIVATVIGQDKPSISFWIVAALGSVLVMTYTFRHSSGGVVIADLALLAAIASAAIGYAIGARVSKEIGGWQVICWALILALPLTIIPTMLSVPASFKDIPTTALLSFVYLSLGSQLLAFFAWYLGMSIGGITRVSQVQLLQPFITLLAAVVLLNEALDTESIVFVSMVVGCIWLSKKMPVVEKCGTNDR